MKIFFAFPFSMIINKESGIVEERYKNFLIETRELIISKNIDVFLAHYREKWGKKLMSAQKCTPLDFVEMQESDLVLAFAGNPISGGVHIELGWASSLGKNIILFLQRNQEYSPLVIGLNQITRTKVVYYDDVTDDIVLENIINAVDELLKDRSMMKD